MAGEPLNEVDVGWHGLAGDRRWAFVRDGATQSGFPWLTQRQQDEMRRYRPSFVDPARPDSSATIVHSPSGASFDVADPALAAELSSTGARALRQDRGVFDAFPVSLISTQSVEQVGSVVGRELEIARFRPNIVMTALDGTPFVEDSLVGATVEVGEMRMRIDKRDGRCVVITIDPASGDRDRAVLRAVVTEREGCIGVYASVVEPGRVVIGDPIIVSR